MADFIDRFPNPDDVGESLYRALHEELGDWLISMPDDEPGEVALSFAADLRDNATRIENIVKAYEQEKNNG